MRISVSWRAWLASLCFVSVGVAAQEVTPPTNDDCLMCHGDESAVREDGTAVFTHAERFAASVHGSLGFSCIDCHADLASAELPHEAKLAAVDCSTCHDSSDYAKSVHGRARDAGRLVAATCVSCHGSHEIRPSSDPESMTYHFNLLRTCGACHGDANMAGMEPSDTGIVATFVDSTHGRALMRGGLLVAPTCVSCHGAHDILGKGEAESKVYRTNVPATCGSCHEGIRVTFARGFHGQQLQDGNPRAPVCSDCHTAHAIPRAETPGWQLEVIGECGTCHQDLLRTYRDTFHGKVTELGYLRVATCADCHGAHEVLPKTDPASPIHAANRQATCNTCHPGTNANFALYDPHADPHDRDRNPFLFFTARFMQVLLAGVFGFFGVHTSLWFSREWRERRRHRLAHAPAARAAGGGRKGTDSDRESETHD